MIFRRKPSDNLPARTTESGDAGMSAKVLSNVLESSTRLQAPAVKAYVARLRKGNSDASPAEIVTKLEKHYLAAVMASGAAVGSAAAFPGIGTLAALSAVAGETVVSSRPPPRSHWPWPRCTASRWKTATVAAIWCSACPSARRAAGAVRELLGSKRTSGAWLAEAELLPLPVVSQVNTRLMQYFVKKYTVKRAAMAFGKMLPVGIGAASAAAATG